jgi:mannose-6-phosphate isomerase
VSEFAFEKSTPKEKVFNSVQAYLGEVGLNITSLDSERPWGGFFVIDESQTAEFIDRYFPDVSKEDIERGFRLSPKILVVAPDTRLSWQKHDRRDEIWRCIYGPVGYHESPTDDQGDLHTLEPGQVVNHKAVDRHRLVGLENWGVVAEIWQHTNPDNPSNEDDIVRIQDDFGR